MVGHKTSFFGRLIGRFVRWALLQAGYSVPTIEGAFDSNVKVKRLEEKLVELDSVICSTMECVEEIRDTQQTAAPTEQSTENVFGEMLTEYLYGYQQKRSDDE